MVVISDILVQGIQMALVLLLAPLLTGFVRKIKARLVRRRLGSLSGAFRRFNRLERLVRHGLGVLAARLRRRNRLLRHAEEFLHGVRRRSGVQKRIGDHREKRDDDESAKFHVLSWGASI